MHVYSLRQWFLKHVELFHVDQLPQNIVVIPVQTNQQSNTVYALKFHSRIDDILTYIHMATIDMGSADRPVRRRQPYVGTTYIAVRYSKILPNDQKNSMTMIIVARVVDGKYSNINVELKIFECK